MNGALARFNSRERLLQIFAETRSGRRATVLPAIKAEILGGAAFSFQSSQSEA
jgi:septum formation topological specificity factor MinE